MLIRTCDTSVAQVLLIQLMTALIEGLCVAQEWENPGFCWQDMPTPSRKAAKAAKAAKP